MGAPRYRPELIRDLPRSRICDGPAGADTRLDAIALFDAPIDANPRGLSMRTAFLVWTVGSASLWLALIFVVRGF